MMKKKTLKIIFNFSFFSSHKQDSNLPLWILSFSYYMKRSLNPLAILAH